MENAATLTIREYREADRDEVTALWEKVFAYGAPHNDPALAISMKEKFGDRLFFVARDRGILAGTIMAGYDGHRGWIYALAVSPDKRRRGIASRLLEQAERKLQDLGCRKINLQVLPGNDEAVAFYESRGFGVEERTSLGKLLEGT